jgi:hypothetical protein
VSLTAINGGAFRECENFAEIIFRGARSEWPAVKRGDGWAENASDLTVHCADGKYVALEYALQEGLRDTYVIVGAEECENGELLIVSDMEGHRISGIGGEAFCGREDITFVGIYDGILNIGYNAFSECPNLTSVRISNSIAWISSGAFSKCPNLTEILFEGTRAEWAEVPKSFDWSDSLSSLRILCTDGEYFSVSTAPRNYGDGNTCYVSGLGNLKGTQILIPAVVDGRAVYGIGNNAFRNCTAFTEMTVSEGVSSIGVFAFWDCTSITSLTLPESITWIGDCAFWGCTSLTDITYMGTQAQWEAIKKGVDWDEEMHNYTIHCADGDIFVK